MTINTMEPVTFSSPELYAEHHPETHRTVNTDHTVSEVQLPGHISVGVVLNGVRRELARFKAGGFFDDARRQQQAASQAGGRPTGE